VQRRRLRRRRGFNITEKRGWILGDTIHSVPLVINYSSTDALILVGANDGMLHAFDDVTGAEQWAYIPDELVSRLRQLTPGVSGSHQFFVDSSPKLLPQRRSEVVVFGSARRTPYAIDVTNKNAPQFSGSSATAPPAGDSARMVEPAYIKTSSGVDAF
jgi:type IV pilus assembly protein PilY1